EEVSSTIDALPCNKTPGSDGLTYEFYKDTKEELLPFLTKLFNYVLNSVDMPNSWNKTQQAFIRGRSITDTILDILTVLRNQSDQSKQHWLLLLDQQKAFDR
ncbi:9378_t:CDS:2, partial [Ambispora leptoticha]